MRRPPSRPPSSGDDPIFVLVIGSDARPGTPMEAGLADSLHVLGINPAAKRATLFGIPRDSYVPISTGGTNKINTAMPGGGVQAQIDTVEQLTGHHVRLLRAHGFVGFTKAVDDIGGLIIDVPFTVDGDEGYFGAGEARYDRSRGARASPGRARRSRAGTSTGPCTRGS